MTRVLLRAALMMTVVTSLQAAPAQQSASPEQGEGTEIKRLNITLMPQPKHREHPWEHEPTLTSQHSFTDLGRDLVLDQKEIWTSPANLRAADANWLIPIGGFTAALFATDSS